MPRRCAAERYSVEIGIVHTARYHLEERRLGEHPTTRLVLCRTVELSNGTSQMNLSILDSGERSVCRRRAGRMRRKS